jgi:hypothetical protein
VRGVREDGQKVLSAVKNMGGEASEADVYSQSLQQGAWSFPAGIGQ